MPKHELDRLAIGLMVVLCTLWGLQQVAIKVANAGISPVWQAGMRSMGATATILLWVLARRVRLFERDGTLWPGLWAGILFAAEFALIFVGLQYTPASRGVIFLYTAPFFVALGALWFLPGESMRRAQWGGMALAFLGVILLFGEHLWLPAGDAWVGDLMILVAAMMWAATTLIVKASALGRASAEKMLLYQLAISAALLPLLSVVMGEPGVFAPTPMVWANILFQAVMVAGVSYLGWFWLIRHYPATRLSSFSFLTPVMGVLAGGLLLHEPLTPAVFAALFLVGTGIWIANRPGKKPSRLGAPPSS
jgi:drug/metabolite transporter (DMT)-like permease